MISIRSVALRTCSRLPAITRISPCLDAVISFSRLTPSIGLEVVIGKAMCEELYRDGGTTVYVCRQHSNGLTEGEHRKLLLANPDAAKWRWQKQLGKDSFVAYQASARGGVVHVEVKQARVLLGGQAVIVAQGELLVA